MGNYAKVPECWPEITESLSFEDIGRLTVAMALYVRGEKEKAQDTINNGANAYIVWPFIRREIETDWADYKEV